MRRTETAVDIGSAEFFARAKARLTFDVPAGLSDASIIPVTGDPGNDRMIEIVAQERPIRPAAVLIGIVAHEHPTVLLTQRAARRPLHRSCRRETRSARHGR